MAIDFPDGPATNDLFTDPISGKTWKWDGEKWIVNITGLTAEGIPDASITAPKLNVAAAGSTGNVLTRNTGATSGFEWAIPTTPDASITAPKLNVAAAGSTGNVLTRNTGSASGFEWAAPVTPTYSWAAYTPTWTQNVTINKTTIFARYSQIDKTVNVSINLTATNAGTALNTILVGLPVTASSNNALMGTALFVDGSVSIPLFAFYNSSSSVLFRRVDTTSTVPFGTGTGAITIAINDGILMNLTYEAA